jgi:hypothetical protein
MAILVPVSQVCGNAERWEVLLKNLFVIVAAPSARSEGCIDERVMLPQRVTS